MKRACGEIGIAADEWQTAPTAALQQLADKLGVK
jgi:hypothetical protein